MEVKTEIKLEQQEIEVLKEAAEIIKMICDEAGLCANCPLEKICYVDDTSTTDEYYEEVYNTLLENGIVK